MRLWVRRTLPRKRYYDEYNCKTYTSRESGIIICLVVLYVCCVWLVFFSPTIFGGVWRVVGEKNTNHRHKGNTEIREFGNTAFAGVCVCGVRRTLPRKRFYDEYNCKTYTSHESGIIIFYNALHFSKYCFALQYSFTKHPPLTQWHVFYFLRGLLTRLH